MKVKKIKTLMEARKILARGGKLYCEAETSMSKGLTWGQVLDILDNNGGVKDLDPRVAAGSNSKQPFAIGPFLDYYSKDDNLHMTLWWRYRSDVDKYDSSDELVYDLHELVKNKHCENKPALVDIHYSGDDMDHGIIVDVYNDYNSVIKDDVIWFSVIREN